MKTPPFQENSVALAEVIFTLLPKQRHTEGYCCSVVVFDNIILQKLGYLVVPDHSNVSWATTWTSIMNNKIMFGSWDSTGGEQLRK